MKPTMDAEDMQDGGSDEATENASGHNAGMGNRAIAAHIKNLHAAAAMSGSVSSSTPPDRSSIKHAPGAKSNMKMPHPTSRPIGG